MVSAGVKPTIAEWRLMPHTVSQALGLVNGWIQELELERQLKILEAMSDGQRW